MIMKTGAEILVARAKALAVARGDAGQSTESTGNRYLIAVCGADRFAIALESIAEVFRPSRVTPVPRSIPPLWGLTAWRGAILPVVVIGQSVPAAERGVIVTLAAGERIIAGLWADEVEGEMAIEGDDLHAAPVATGIREVLISGVTSDAVSVFDAGGLARMLDDRTRESDRPAVITP